MAYPATPLTICTSTRAVRAGSSLSISVSFCIWKSPQTNIDYIRERARSLPDHAECRKEPWHTRLNSKGGCEMANLADIHRVPNLHPPPPLVHLYDHILASNFLVPLDIPGSSDNP